MLHKLWRVAGQPTAAHWHAWMGQWAELLHAGQDPLQALALSIELNSQARTSAKLRHILQAAHGALEKGESLIDAFNKASHGNVPAMLQLALECASKSGDLATSLQVQANRWQMVQHMRKDLWRGLSYPLLVLGLAIASWIFLAQATQGLVKTSPWRFTPANFSDWLLLTGGLGALLLAPLVWFEHRHKHTKRASTMDRWGLLMPGPAWAASDYFFVLACELQSGIDLLQCLRPRVHNSGSKTVFAKNTTLELNQFTMQLQHLISRGAGLSAAIAQAQGPRFLVQQAKIAEQSGKLSDCFLLASKVYELRARNAQHRLQTTLPPITLASAALVLALAYQTTLAPLYANLGAL